MVAVTRSAGAGFFRVVDRLSLLLKPKELLLELSSVGFIAGGSVVYALTDYVPVTSVGDIDVFVPSESVFNYCLKLLNKKCAVEDYLVYNKDEISVATVVLRDYVNVQLIMAQADTMEQVLHSFDLDYVQCGIHCGKLYQTEACKQALAARTVSLIYDTRCNLKRLQKAVKKGFSVPLVLKCMKDCNDKLPATQSMQWEAILTAKKQFTNFYLPDRQPLMHCYSSLKADKVEQVEPAQPHPGLKKAASLVLLLADGTRVHRSCISSKVTIEHIAWFEAGKVVGKMYIKEKNDYPFKSLQAFRVLKGAVPEDFKLAPYSQYVICYTVCYICNPTANWFPIPYAYVCKILPAAGWRTVEFPEYFCF